MTYADVLDIAVPKLEDKHLARYVAGFEAGTLTRGCGQCAVGHMEREPGEAEYGAYHRYSKRDVPAWCRAEKTAPLAAIEIVFEGYGGLWFEDSFRDGILESMPDAERARLIYDRCIEEQARRAAERSNPDAKLVVLRAEVGTS